MSDYKVRTTSPYITNAQRKENERRWAILDVCEGLDAYQVEQALAYAYGWRALPPFHCEDQGLAGWKPRAER